MSDKSFYILDAAVQDDFNKWMDIWNLWPEREVYAHPNYLKLYSDEKTEVQCAVYQSSEGNVLYPFLYRDLKMEEFCNLDVNPIGDIITPYGYGGAFVWGCKNSEYLASEFWNLFNHWAANNNIISEVIKFSLFNENLLDYPGKKEEKLKNIVVDLEMSEDELWMNFEHKVRKNVKRAKQSGVIVILDPEGEKQQDFLNIYYETMDRRGADEKYYFSKDYFDQLRKGIPGQFHYFHAIHENKIISTELILISEDKIYSFLGGTESNNFLLRPNDLLKYEIILWAKKQGKKKFVLGGGYNPDDGIYQYKYSFAPKGSIGFFVGARILNQSLYDSLIENKKQFMSKKGIDWKPIEGNIPEYRM